MTYNKERHCITVLLLAWLLVACGENLTDQAYVERAQDYVDAGDLASASIDLKTALQQNSENMPARMLLTHIYFETGDMPSAEKELLRVQEAAPDQFNNTLLPRLAQVRVVLGKHDQVLSMAVENLEPASLATVLAAQALSHITKAEFYEAGEKIDEALGNNPESPYVYYANARLLFHQRKLTTADATLVKLQQLDSNYIASWGLRGDIARLGGSMEEADEFYSRAVELDPSILGHRFKRAIVRIQMRDYGAAQQDLDILLRSAAQSTRINYAQGLIHFNKESYREAISAFLVAMPDRRLFPDVAMYLGLSYYKLGDLDKALSYAEEFHSNNDHHPIGNKLLAALLVANNKPAKAEQLVLAVLARQPEDIEALNILANALIKQQRMDEAIDVLARVIELDPQSSVAHTRLGASYAQDSRPDDAVSHIRKAIELDPASGQADMVLVLTHLQREELNLALEAARQYQQRNPISAAPYILIGRVHLISSDPDAAREAFLQATKLEPGNPSANHNLATLALARGNIDQAETYYLEVLKVHKNFLPTLTFLAALEQQRDNYQAMESYLKRAIDAHPQAIQPIIVMARYYLVSGQAERVPLLLSSLSDTQKNTPSVLRLLGRAQLAMKEYVDARYSLLRLVELEPENSENHRLLAAAYFGLGNEDRSLAQLQQSLANDPDNPKTHMAMATYSLSRGNAEQLAREITILQRLVPDDPEVMPLRAALARLQGDQTEALELLEQTHRSVPSTASMLNLSRQHMLMDNDEAALSLLELWVAEHENDVTARLALAEKYLKSKDWEKAIDTYSSLLSEDEDNLVALNNMAWFLREDNPEVALEYAQRANSLAPNSPPVMDTLAMILSANKQHRQARIMNRAVVKLAPNKPTYVYHGALIADAAGDRMEAYTSLATLLGEHASFPERDKAEQFLEALSADN